jgi:1,4-dihydroxy-2-naphthoyl-CoA hydrolase
MSDASSHRLRTLIGLMPFSEELGIALERADAGDVVGTLAWSAERCTTGGMLHGGVLMALADTVGAICAYLNLPEGASTATIESKTNFLRGVRSGVVRASARPVHVGSRTIVVQTDVADDQDRPVALVVQTQAVLLG